MLFRIALQRGDDNSYGNVQSSRIPSTIFVFASRDADASYWYPSWNPVILNPIVQDSIFIASFVQRRIGDIMVTYW